MECSVVYVLLNMLFKQTGVYILIFIPANSCIHGLSWWTHHPFTIQVSGVKSIMLGSDAQAYEFCV
jgi:hypothetical protein